VVYQNHGPDTWDPGEHSYQFYNYDESISEFGFSVSSEAELYGGFALLRPGVLSTCEEGHLVDFGDLNTNQATHFIRAWGTYAMTPELADTYFDALNIHVYLDGEEYSLDRTEVMPYSDEDWEAYLCGLTLPE
jgi:hypothetical protein